MGITPIKTDADYRAALKDIESLMMAGFDSQESEDLNVLITLVQAYETKHFPIDFPGPVEANIFNIQHKD